MTLQNLESLTLVWGRSANIVVVLSDTITTENEATLTQDIQKLTGISQSQRISPEEALNRFKARGPEAAALVEGSLPTSCRQPWS